MSFLRSIPYLRTFSFSSRRQLSCRCPEDSNMLSTTFKVNCCILLCTSAICNNITYGIRILRKDIQGVEEQLNKIVQGQNRK